MISETYSVSRYLQVLEIVGSEKFVCYHSLFGNPHLVSRADLLALEVFRESSTCEDALRLLRNSDASLGLMQKFQDIYFLVPDGFNERGLVDADLKRRAMGYDRGQLITAMQLSVSEKCNLNCSYCFADRVDERASNGNFRARNSSPLMTTEVATKAIDVISNLVRSHGKKSLVLKFSGREPLLNYDTIRKSIEYCASAHSDLHFRYAITTNGTQLTASVVRYLKRHSFYVTISLDGIAEGNAARVMKSGVPSFPLVDEGLRMLQREGVPYSVASVLTDENFEFTGFEFLHYLKNRSATSWEVKFGMQGRRMYSRTAEEYARRVVDLHVYGKNIGITVTGDWYEPYAALFHTTRRLTDTQTHRLSPSSCSATDHQITVEPSGSIHPCRAMEMMLGRIDRLYEMLKSKDYKHLVMRTYSNVEACHGCPLEGFCQGVCLGHSESQGDIYSVDRFYCSVYKEACKQLLLNEQWLSDIASGGDGGNV